MMFRIIFLLNCRRKSAPPRSGWTSRTEPLRQEQAGILPAQSEGLYVTETDFADDIGLHRMMYEAAQTMLDRSNQGHQGGPDKVHYSWW